jgi:Ca2+-binding RTX toxin-like protein
VRVDLMDNANNTGGDAQGDVISNIQNLIGSDVNNVLDRLYGDNGSNIIQGLRGINVIDGRGGFDFASYADATTGVKVDLSISGEQQTNISEDTLINIEGLIGSAHGDTLTGNGLDNELRGGAGNDSLYGLGGNDTLNGGADNDYLDGGDGFDIASYAGATAPVTVDLTKQGVAQDTGGAGTDTLVSIEGLIGSSHSDTFTLSATDTQGTIDGGDGSDTVVLQGLVDGGSYELSGLADRLDNIETLDIKDGVSTTLTVTSQDVQNMVDKGSASVLRILADGGPGADILVIDAPVDTYSTEVFAEYTQYTLYSDNTLTLGQEIAQIQWQSVA